MKKIGFIDYYLDEWHANNYPQWIKENCASAGRDMELTYAYGDIDKAGGRNTEHWCREYGVQRVLTIEELVDKSDYIFVLSPDNPEHHEKLSKIALASKKPVYIDKTFSPDFATGVRIYDWAEKHGTPVFSSSALRFARELLGYPNDEVNPSTIEYVAATGGGHYKNYSVHQLEMIVSLMGTGTKRIKSLSTTSGRLLIFEYEDGRRASMHQMEKAPFQLNVQLKNGDGVFINRLSDFFPILIDRILTFFETGIAPVRKEETLEIMSMIEGGYKAMKKDDTWFELEHID